MLALLFHWYSHNILTEVFQGARVFSAPDGFQYRWVPSATSRDILVSFNFLLRIWFFSYSLSDSSKIPTVIQSRSSVLRAPHGTRLERSTANSTSSLKLAPAQLLEMFLTYSCKALTLTVFLACQMHPPIMDFVIVTAMLYRLCNAFGYWGTGGRWKQKKHGVIIFLGERKNVFLVNFSQGLRGSENVYL